MSRVVLQWVVCVSLGSTGVPIPASSPPATAAPIWPVAPQGDPVAATPAGAAATDSIIVMEVSGRVRSRATADAEWKPLRENDVLRPGAEIQTGLRSHAALRVGANSTILLDAGTTLLLPELSREGATLVTRAAVRSGRADIKVDRVGLDNDFQVVTPTATIAVSGTTLAVQNGRLLGTEVTGARSNALAAIEARWIARRLAFFFGDGTSSDRFMDPAFGGWNDTVERHLMPGLLSDDSQLEQALVNGTLQNVIFNINDLQRVLNIDDAIVQDHLAIVSALALLLEIRNETDALSGQAGGAAALAASFARKAMVLAADAISMLDGIEQTVSMQATIAQIQLGDAIDARKDAQSLKEQAFARRDDALEHLEDTIISASQGDWRGAQRSADAASLAALLASQAALGAASSADAAWAAASKAALAAGQAQAAINQYFSRVSEIEACAAAAGAEAAIAASAAQAAQSLDALARQIGALVQHGDAAGLLNEIQANVRAAAAAAQAAASSRDEALAAASNARTMGERVLFNWAAVYAAQAAAEAAQAGEAATAAALAAFEADAAATLAQSIAQGGGG